MKNGKFLCGCRDVDFQHGQNAQFHSNSGESRGFCGLERYSLHIIHYLEHICFIWDIDVPIEHD